MRGAIDPNYKGGKGNHNIMEGDLSGVELSGEWSDISLKHTHNNLLSILKRRAIPSISLSLSHFTHWIGHSCNNTIIYICIVCVCVCVCVCVSLSLSSHS